MKMVNEFCGFKHGVIGTDKMPSDTTLNNMKKVDLIKPLHTAQHNYESLMWFYNNAVNVNMSQLKNNGWIPCSERLPEEDGKYIVTVKNLTGRWIMKNNVFVCNYWDDDFHFQGWDDNEVIAWQPLPLPYRKGDTE